jgi:Protein kinase domain/SIR2-like domain
MTGTLDPRVGSDLAGYRIERLLGAGGMGTVYLAYDPRLNRRVALKIVPHEAGADSAVTERFLLESRLAAVIEHPNIVPVHQTGEESDALFIAMRCIEGADLAVLLEREGPQSPERALALLDGIAAALDAAHARGLVHRDVKPSNVLVATRDGSGREHAYLTDFGISKLVAGAAALTATGQMLGTPGYVAPEQVGGQEVDGRADVYSLGCLLFECLTGEQPFVRDTPVAVLHAHVNEPPPLASERRNELPVDIDGVLTRALSKRPEDRYETCAELIDAARIACGIDTAAGVRVAAATRSRALDDHCIEVLRLLLRGRLVPVVGLGANRAAELPGARSAPDDLQLSLDLARLFDYPDDRPLELTRVSQHVAVTRGSGPLQDELHDLLHSEFRPGPVEHLLARLPRLTRAALAPYPLLVSTTYDSTLQQAFADAGEELDVVAYVSTGPESARFRHLRPDGTATVIDVPNTYTVGASGEERTVLLRLQGGVDLIRDRESFLVTEDDHIEYLLHSHLSGLVPVGLAARLRRSHLLFLGCSPTDWSLRALFRAIWREPAHLYRSWAVSPHVDWIDREFWRDRGVDLIDIQLAGYIDALERHAAKLQEVQEQQ